MNLPVNVRPVEPVVPVNVLLTALSKYLTRDAVDPSVYVIFAVAKSNQLIESDNCSKFLAPAVEVTTFPGEKLTLGLPSAYLIVTPPAFPFAPVLDTMIWSSEVKPGLALRTFLMIVNSSSSSSSIGFLITVSSFGGLFLAPAFSAFVSANTASTLPICPPRFISAYTASMADEIRCSWASSSAFVISPASRAFFEAAISVLAVATAAAIASLEDLSSTFFSA